MKTLWEVRKVKKTAKIVSALLVLVLVMAQIVCVNAAAKTPNFSVSAKQTDHFEKTITLSVTNGASVSVVGMSAYDEKDGKIVGSTEKVSIDADTFSVSIKVRPNDVSYVRIVVRDKNNKDLYNEWYAVGPNGYYDINAGSSSSSSNGTYDGLSSSSSSNGGYWTGSSNNNSNVWDYYDPNAWHGYYEETRKDTTTYYVTCRTLNVRKGAGTSYGKVGTLSRYTEVEVYSIEKDWAVIEFNGHLRYVNAKYLKKVK